MILGKSMDYWKGFLDAIGEWYMNPNAVVIKLDKVKSLLLEKQLKMEKGEKKC